MLVLCLLWLLGTAVVAAGRGDPDREGSSGGRPTASGRGSAAAPSPSSPSSGPGTATKRGDQTSTPWAARSQYIKTTRTAVLDGLGCTEAGNLGHSRQASAIVVLDFGRPARHHGLAGTSLFGNAFASTSDIARGAEAYATGFHRCAGGRGPHLHVALGTSNFGHRVSFRHGAAWARMVNAANTWASAHGDGDVEFAGANDIELAWNGPGPSKDWVRGYDSEAAWPFYDYGDAAGCPPAGDCIGAWSQEDVWYVSWGARSAWPLPEIYTPNGSMAQEWYRMSLYSYLHHGWRMSIAGALSQRTACVQSSDPCWGMNNAPAAAWRQLNRLLNSDPRTAQPLRWLSDFRWADRD